MSFNFIWWVGLSLACVQGLSLTVLGSQAIYALAREEGEILPRSINAHLVWHGILHVIKYVGATLVAAVIANAIGGIVPLLVKWGLIIWIIQGAIGTSMTLFSYFRGDWTEGD